MYEAHLREFGFTYSTCGSFAILKERIQTQEIKKKKKKTRNRIFKIYLSICKAKESQLKQNSLCFGNISKDCTINSWKKTCSKGYMTCFLCWL